MAAPDFVVVGHVTRDLVPGGWLLGGTVTFAAVQAHRLGLRAGIVTSAAPEVIERLRAELPFADVAAVPSDVTTTFQNVYDHGNRTQYIREQGAPIDHDAVPDAWRASSVVLLGPIWGELAPAYARAFDASSLVGVSAQGWLREADADARVRHTLWRGDPFWPGGDIIFVSDEDLSNAREELERWTAAVPMVALTHSSRGAAIYADKQWRRIDAYPETEVDPTGAGDTFATAFLIRLHETGDVAQAAAFGAAAASLSVRAAGAAAMPGRAEVEERMRQYPDVGLR